MYSTRELMSLSTEAKTVQCILGEASIRLPLKGTVTIDLLTGTLQDGTKLLCQHHVALDLKLARHERLHTIKLALCHGHEVSICECDGHVSLVFTPFDCTIAV